MKILGIDPGSFRCGWAVLDRDQLYAHGVLRLPPKDALARRLGSIFKAMESLIHQHKPEVMVIEKAFTAKNPASSLVLAQVRGVCLALADLEGLSIEEKTPTSAKKSFTGHGHASKEQIILMVNHIYGVVLPEDAADAVALALSCCGAW